jgi:uncharacterized protein (DUF2267 family)
VLELRQPAVRVRVNEATVNEAGAYAVYDLAPHDAGDRAGIQVLAAGFGDTPVQAFAEAAFQWTTGVFTTVRHWLQPEHHTCFAKDFHMLVRSDDSREDFAWRVHVGPVLSRAWGDEKGAPSFDTNDVVSVLFDHIHPNAAHRTLFWIEAYVVRYADGTVNSTCRLQNQEWNEGEEALKQWASTWRVAEGVMVSARQFLLFEPISPDALPSRNDLEKALKNKTRAPWWKRLFAHRST